MKLHECPAITRNDAVKNNIFMATAIQWTNMDILVWVPGITMAALENAEYVMLKVNTNMPRVLSGGKEAIHIS
jgi:hypothetical protein